MARVFTDGFEYNSVTSNISRYETVSGAPTITSTAANVRSGTYALAIASLVSATPKGVVKKWIASTAAGPFWGRAYIYITAYPGISNHIVSFSGASGTAGATPRCRINLETNGTLTLWNSATTPTQIGSPSSVLSLNTWYMIELKHDGTPAAGAKVIEARLNGTVFATSSVESQGNPLGFSVGGNLSSEANTTGSWFFDDIAVNDSTGTVQNTYPGSGKVIRLKPNAAGDVNTFATQTGGTAGSANNYTRVNEVTPNDATTMNASNTLSQEDLFNMDDSGIGAGDTVNVVEVHGRFNNAVADTVTAIKFEIESAAAGTKTQSAAIIPNTTTWNTDGTTSPRNAPIVTYTTPGGSAWSQATLDSMQVGYTISAGGTNAIQVSAVSAVVEYTPSSGSNTTVTPGVTALVLATFVPLVTLTANLLITPAVAALTLASFAPAVTAGNNQLVTPGNANVSTATYVPTATVSNNIRVTPPVTSTALASLAPLVTATNNQIVIPGTKASSLASFPPIVTVSTSTVVTPQTASLSLAGLQPVTSLTASSTVIPFPVTLSFQGLAPTVTTTVKVLPSIPSDSLVVTSYSDTLTIRQEISDTISIMSVQDNITISAQPSDSLVVVSRSDTLTIS